MEVAFIHFNFSLKDFDPMSRKTGILLSITALLLIPILLGMTPLNFVHKMAAGCPFSQGKQAVKCNSCPFHSIVSQADPAVVNPDSTPLDQSPIPALGIQIADSDPILSSITDSSAPLRC